MLQVVDNAFTSMECSGIVAFSANMMVTMVMVELCHAEEPSIVEMCGENETGENN